MTNSTQYEEFQVDPEDVVLLILEANERLFGRKSFKGITRLEKLIFLLEEETDFEGVGDIFAFKAYNYGPFSKEVYSAIDFLTGYELVTVKEISHYSESARAEEEKLSNEILDFDDSIISTSTEIKEKNFFLTNEGRRLAKALREGIKKKNEKDIESLDMIVKKYGKMRLNQLIKYVYKRYPKMTEKSVHPEAIKEY